MPQLYKCKQISEKKIEELPPIMEIHPRSDTHEPSFSMFYVLMCLINSHAKQDQYAQGMKDGLQQSQTQLQTERDTLQNLLHNLPCAVEQIRMSLQTDIADIVYTIIEQLFLQQPPSSPFLEKQINALLTELNHQQSLKIHLHPEDIAHLQQGTIKLNSHALPNIEIVPQPSLLPGGCLVYSEHGMFDVSLENRFARFMDILWQIKQEHTDASLA